MTDTIQARLHRVHQRIADAARACGRQPTEIRLVAVAKTWPADTVAEAVAAGVTEIGENYIQEAREKYEQLRQTPLIWHFIGHLQTNKVKYALRLFDLIHTVDSYRLALELDRGCRKLKRIQPVLIQVNIAGETTKSGVPPDKALALAAELSGLECVRVHGLMTMPPYFNEPERVRPFFAELRRLKDRIQEQGLPNVRMHELSMGMTGDFEAAIAEGATLVRIGTAIFGERP
jgi:pyridoxal phosphate enzyme (YggS family)